MNILDYLNRAAPNGGITTIDQEMIEFNYNLDYHIQLLNDLLGKSAATSLIDSVTPELTRVKKIIERAAPGMDFYSDRDAYEDIKALFNKHKNNSFFSTGEITEFHKKGHQHFACDGSFCYDVTEMIIHDSGDDSLLYTCPLIESEYSDPNTRTLKYAFPEEGRGGLAAIMFLDKNDGKKRKPHGTFFNYRFIYRRELNLPAHAIAENIINEIESGETPITGGGLPGWQ